MFRRCLVVYGFHESDRMPRPHVEHTLRTPPDGSSSAFSNTRYRRNKKYNMPRGGSDGYNINNNQNTMPKSYAEAAAGASITTTRGAASAVHMYANKENAWKDYTDDRYHFLRHMKYYWYRITHDRAVKYYFMGVLVLLLCASSKLLQMQRQMMAEQGLIGPRKKQYRSRLTVVLDVDETLVSYGDKAFRMHAGLVVRPYLAELLDYLNDIDAEVVLWSACSDRYMRQVLSVIDPDGVRVSQYIVRDSTWYSNDNYYEKNLLWLKRPLEDVIMIENRPLSARNCNGNVLLVDDFIRGEYMDTGQDHPAHDTALRTVKCVIEDLEGSGMPVLDYLQDTSVRHPDIKEIPCHLAVRQLPDELARGVFFFVGDKYRPA